MLINNQIIVPKYISGGSGRFQETVLTPQEIGAYSGNNPSGFITGVDLSNYITKTNGQFLDRPTVNGTGVLLSGEAAGTTNFRYTPVSGFYNLLSNNRYSFDTFAQISTGILPSNPQKGDEIELYDSAGTWHLNPLIVDNNGNYIEQKKDMLECNVRHGLIKLIYTTQNNIGWRIYPMSIHNVPFLLQPLIGITGSAISGIIPFNAILTGINLIDPEQNPVDEWYWNLNTGDGYAISGQTIAYTYLQTGLYNVTLSGLNAAGFGITQQLINVFLPYVPTVSITSNKLSGLAPFTGQLSGTNTTQPAQYSPVDNWYWDFNNDTIFDATGQNTQVIYNTTGTYTSTAYGVNLGGTGIENITINVVEPFIPIPSVSLSANKGAVPLTVQFSGSNLADPEFSPVNHWYWNITGDSTPEFDQSTISYTFNETGIYTFTLTAVNSAGSGTVTGTITGLLSVPTSGLLVRFNADVGVSETGGIITSWTDQQNGIVATAFNGPSLLTNQLNGRNAISFDGANDYLTFTFPTPIQIAQKRTFVIIGRYNNPSSTSQRGYLNSAANDLCYVFKNSNEDKSYYFSQNNQIQGPNVSLANYHVMTVVHNGVPNTNFIQINGVKSTTVSYGSMSNLPQLTNMVIGGRGAPSEIILGQIVEVLIYNRELSTEEIEQIETYANI